MGYLVFIQSIQIGLICTINLVVFFKISHDPLCQLIGGKRPSILKTLNLFLEPDCMYLTAVIQS